MPATIPQTELLAGFSGLSMGALSYAVRQKSPEVAIALNQVAEWSTSLVAQLQKFEPGIFDQVLVTKPDGALNGWIGSRNGRDGAWFPTIWIGASEATAKLSAVDGVLQIDGSVLISGTVVADSVVAASIDATALNIHKIIPVITWGNNSPSAGRVSWTGAVYYDGTAYPLTPGDTNLAYIWWQVGNTTLSTGTSFTPSATVFLLAVNASGTHDTAWDKLGAGSVVTNHYADLSITNAKVVSLTASKLTAGTIDANEISVINLNASEIVTGTLSANFVSGGTLDFDNVTAVNLVVTGDAVVGGTLNLNNVTVAGDLSANRIVGGTLNFSLITATNISASSINAGTMSADRLNGGSGSIAGLTVVTLDVVTNFNCTDPVAVFAGILASGTVQAANLSSDAGVSATSGFTNNGNAGATGSFDPAAVTSIVVSGGLVTGWS